MSALGWALLLAIAALLVGVLVGRRLASRSDQASSRPPFGGGSDAAPGYSYLVSNEIDRAIESFTRVAEADPKAIDVHLVLGNLHREKGQVEKAIQIHQRLLERADLDPAARVPVLLCLAEDFQKVGFIDRAASKLQEVMEIEPRNRDALLALEKLHEGSRDWARAYEVAKQSHDIASHSDERVLAFLRNQMGEEAHKNGDLRKAQNDFEAALRHDAHSVPAALNLGGLFLAQRKFKRARDVFEEVIDRDPRRLTVVWRRLQGAFRALGEEGRLEQLCQRQIEADPDDWRARVVLGELAEETRDWDAAAGFYSDALRRNPHAFSLHHRLLSVMARSGVDSERLRRYLDLCDETMMVVDRYLCVRCHYRASELLWRCPSCQAWDPFVQDPA